MNVTTRDDIEVGLRLRRELLSSQDSVEPPAEPPVVKVVQK